MADEKRRKKKPVKKKKPQAEEKKGLLAFGKKKGDQGEKPKKQREETVAGNGQVLQHKFSLLGKVAAWALVAFLALGAVLSVYSTLNPPQQVQPVVEGGNDPSSQQAGEYGRSFVGAWLRATDEESVELERYMPVGRQDITEEEPTEFRDLSVASVETDENGVSTVIVSAEVYTLVEDEEEDEEEGSVLDDEDEAAAEDDDEEATTEDEDDEDGDAEARAEPATGTQDDEDDEDEDEDEAASEDDEGDLTEEEIPTLSEDDDEVTGVWVPTWYQVNVYHDGETFTPLGWPAPVAAPETGDEPRMEYSYEGSAEIESTVEAFFEAYVLEQGDVARLTHPESDIEPLGPTSYQQIEITDVTTDEDHRDEIPEDGTVARAFVQLNLGTSEDHARAASYALTLETRGGRWEVRNLDPAPAVDAEDITVELDDDGDDTEDPAPDTDTGADSEPENTTDSE